MNSHPFYRVLTLLLFLFVGACSDGGGGGESVPAPATIAVQPVSASAVTGASVTFGVAAIGDGLSYQWQRSIDAGLAWASIANAIAASYTIAAVDPSLDGYQYRVVVTGPATSVTSSAVTLTVAPAIVPPSLSVHPADQSAVAGGSVNFSVTATGTSVAYQWQSTPDRVTWSNVSGANGATLTLPAVTVADSGTSFRALVSNSAGTITSNPALLTVAPAPDLPVITAQPASASVLATQLATFAVAAMANPTPSYQWQRSADRIVYSDIASATGASYTTPPTILADSGTWFRVAISNVTGTVVSQPAQLTVANGSAAAITAQPADIRVSLPATATFTAAATGTPTPSYQWQVSADTGLTFANINGATSASYTTPATTLADSGKQFRVIATNALGSAASRAAVLTVINAGTGGTNPGIAVDAIGNIFVTVGPEIGVNTGNPAFYGVREVTAAGAVVQLAGSINRGYVDGPASISRFEQPSGIAVNSAGDVFVADSVNHVIRRISNGTVSTFAGTGQAGFTNGNGRLAAFNLPKGLSIDAVGNLYVADFSNNAIRRITPAGDVTTVATVGGQPLSVGVDAAGNLYAVAQNSRDIRKISPAGIVTTMATLPVVGQSVPSGLAVDAGGNVFVASGFQVYGITPSGAVALLPVGNSFIVSPPSIAVDAAGNLYIPDQAQSLNAPHEIRKVTPSGTVTLIP